MARIPGIELDEIYAKYELHPDLLDLYVEGEFDRDLLNQLLLSGGLAQQVSVFTVNEVEVPNSVLEELHLRIGSNKYRLIALAILLTRRLAAVDTNVTCIVDADDDRVLQRTIQTQHLLYTDYCSMESYCVSEQTLSRFLILGCNLQVESVRQFLSLASLVLPVEFVLRAVNDTLALEGKIPEISAGLMNKRDLASFDPAKFVQSFVQLNNFHRQSTDIEEKFAELVGLLPEDLRDKMNGHDLVELLFEFMANAGSLRLQSKARDVLLYGGRLLASALDFAFTFSEPMFRRLHSAAREGTRLWPVEAAAVGE